MKFYDITRELFSTPVYPGDPVPEHEWLKQIKNGDSSNLTYLKLCAHNATHMDAPRHFVEGGRTIDELELSQVMGMCSVVEYDGMLDAKTARALICGKEKKRKSLCISGGNGTGICRCGDRTFRSGTADRRSGRGYKRRA